MRGTTLALALTSVMASSLPADVRIDHQQGTTVLPETPHSVITLDISVLDSLDALDVPVAGLPRDFVPDSLNKYRTRDYENVGSLFEPDIETVAAMQPDLAIVANRSATAFNSLNQLVPTIDLTVNGDRFLEEFYARTETLGEIFGREEQAAGHLARIRDKADRIRAQADQAGNILLIMTSGGKLTAYGPGSRFGFLHDELGLTSAAADLEDASHGDPISFEYLVKRDPDYIFVIDRDSAIGRDQASARATLDNDLVRRTQAFQNDRIVYLDSVNWYIVSSGINAVDATLDEILEALAQ